MHTSAPLCPPYSSSASSDQTCTIEPVTTETVDQVVTFINNARKVMFPTLHTQLPAHLARWVQSGHFLVARDISSKEMIASIGIVPYDHRFPQLQYQDVRTVEVVRLFVQPEYRRSGLGTRLFEELKRKAEEEGVRRLYLHTHWFLPRAVEFWEGKGFQVVHIEEDEVWRTVHMEMMLGS